MLKTKDEQFKTKDESIFQINFNNKSIGICI